MIKFNLVKEKKEKINMPYGNNNYNGGPLPSNNLWVGNNYSSGSYSQMPRNNYPVMNQAMPSFPVQSQMLQPSQVNNILQVMGPESAQAFQIGPDSQVILMDSSNKPVFYRKKATALDILKLELLLLKKFR